MNGVRKAVKKMKLFFLLVLNAILFAVHFTEAERSSKLKGNDTITVQSFVLCILRLGTMTALSFKIANVYFAKSKLYWSKFLIVVSVICFLSELLILRFFFLKFLSFVCCIVQLSEVVLRPKHASALADV